MLGLLAPTLLAIALAKTFGGSLRSLYGSRVHWWPAVLGTFAVELALYTPPINAQPWALQTGPWIWLGTRLALLAVLIRNGWPTRVAVGWPWLVAAAGVGLNTLVIALNDGHMPQSRDAAVTIWGANHFDPALLHNVAPMGPATLLPWLGDVIVEPSWFPRPNIVSVGDVLLAAGIACWAFLACRPRMADLCRIVGLFRAPHHGPARPTRRCST
jgi:hypothetical protein